MNINWLIRFKNPVFIARIAVAIAIPILGYFGLTVQDITSWGMLFSTLGDAISNPYVVGAVIVSVFNAIPDPTTKGIGDSPRAMSYDEPA